MSENNNPPEITELKWFLHVDGFIGAENDDRIVYRGATEQEMPLLDHIVKTHNILIDNPDLAAALKRIQFLERTLGIINKRPGARFMSSQSEDIAYFHNIAAYALNGDEEAVESMSRSGWN